MSNPLLCHFEKTKMQQEAEISSPSNNSQTERLHLAMNEDETGESNLITSH